MSILLPYQVKWVNDTSRFKIGMLSRQSGKTFQATYEIAEDVAKAEFAKKRSDWVIFSRGDRQAKEALDEGVKVHLRAFDAAFESFDSDYKLKDGARILTHEVITKFGSKITAVPANPDTARGYSRNVLLDEFAFHEDSYKIWTALFPIVSRPNLKLRIISTPNGRNNKFADIIAGSDSIWSRHIVDINSAVKQGLDRNVEELRAAIGDEIAWRQEFLLDLDIAGYDQFFEWALLHKASQRRVPEKNEAPLLLGVDVARYGDDDSVFFFRQGNDARSLPMLSYHGLDTMQVAGKIIEMNGKHNIETVFIDGGGVGGGVVDRCRELGANNIVDVSFGAKSDTPDCFNKRAEMYYLLKNWLITGCIINDELLHKELVSLKYRYTEDRKIKLEPKEELKKRIGKSPDKADALALTFAYPVADNKDVDIMQRLRNANYSYDPLNNRNFREYDPFSSKNYRI